MHQLLQQLWRDDQGALISTEFLFLATVLVIGIIPGVVALRNGIAVEMTELANAIVAMTGSGSTCPAPVCTPPENPIDINILPCQ